MALRNRQVTMLLPMRVWDLPVRLFHWLLVVLLPACYISMKAGQPALHFVLGYMVMALVLFRLVWGVIGSDTARFARFVASPGRAVHHLRRLFVREPDTEVGHNPAGGWMVLLLLLLVVLQVATGPFARNRHNVEGPLAKYVADSVVSAASLVHSVTVKLIIGAALLHVLVIVIYVRAKGQNLVRPMLTGKKRLPAATRAPRLRSPLLALAVLLVIAAAVAALATQV